MRINIGFQKIYLSQIKEKKIFLLIGFTFIIIYFSVLIDVNTNVILMYHSIIDGIAYRDFSVLAIIRFLVLHLIYIYFFSLSTNFKDNTYLYLAFNRLGNIGIWYQNTLLYAAFLGMFYWGIMLIGFIIYLLILTAFIGELSLFYHVIFSKKTVLFFLFSILSSISLANIFLSIKNIVKKENIAFASVTFLLLCYIFSFYLVGERHFLFFNTDILTVERISSTFFGENAIIINIFWQFIQNLIISIFTITYLNKKGLE